MTYTGQCIPDINRAVDRATGTRPIYTTAPRMPVAFYVDAPLYDRMMAAVRECDTSISAFCRQAVAAYLEELERQ